MKSLKWINKDAISTYEELLGIYGEPTALSKKANGIALWLEKDIKGKKYMDHQNCFYEHEIRDEEIEHFCPKKHTDYFYSSVKVPVKPNQIDMLYSISGSIKYDPLKNMLTARCATIHANVATLKLATDLLLGNKVEYSKFDIKYHDLKSVHKSGAYGALIMSTNDDEHYKNLYRELCDNVGELNKRGKLNSGYWGKAFSFKDEECHDPNLQSGGEFNNPNYKRYIRYLNKYIELKREYVA